MAKKTYDAKAKTVLVECKTRPTGAEKGTEGTPCAFTIDFSSASEEQIFELASRAVVIGTQALLRAEKDMSAGATQTVDVAEFCSRERGTFEVTPESLAKKVQAKLTPEERKALIELLKKQK